MLKQRLLRNITILLLLFLLLLGGGHVFAQDTFKLSSWTVDGGGGTLQGSNFTLHATLSQSDSGVLAGGEFRLYGGFWGPVKATGPTQHGSQQGLYLPTVSKK